MATVAACLGGSAIFAARHSPDPARPRTRRWYRRLDYRLLRQPSGAARNAAVGLWLASDAMVGGWTELFFGQKRLERERGGGEGRWARRGDGGAIRRLARLRDAAC